MPHGRDLIVARAAEVGRAFAAAGRPVILTTTDFATGYADAPAGQADAPWALPQKGLPPGFAADAYGTVAPGFHNFAVEKTLPRIARVRPTAEIVAALDR